ncbi:MAG TPA: SDR family oxidoreductase [Rubrobacter sp.]|nr:SDR family oxidoreductase [Rubrobacter sp.]
MTGAGAGIGRAIALRLAEEDAAVVVADVDEMGGAETVRRIEAGSGRGAFVLADVSVEAGAREMVDFAGRTFGGLDVLANNAGGAPGPHFPEADPEHWLRTLDLNLRGVMLSTYFAIQAMRRRGGGVIVDISSMAGIGYGPHDAPEYAAGKAGVTRLTSSLVHLKEKVGVRVNCICPGWVETEAVHEALARMTEEEKMAQSMPPPTVLIQPEEIADAVVMFVRDDTLAGRVMVWPDGGPQRLVPGDVMF